MYKRSPPGGEGVRLKIMTHIASNIKSLKEQIPPSVKLVAVSKTKPESDILEAYNSGHKIFGENRVRELLQKRDNLPTDIEWHMIGHLQGNKVKQIVPFISMIQSADSFRLLKTIELEASGINRIVDCLLQIHIAEEDTKFGFSMEEIHEMIRLDDFRKLNSLRICGVMGMATFTDDQGGSAMNSGIWRSVTMNLKGIILPINPNSGRFQWACRAISG